MAMNKAMMENKIRALEETVGSLMREDIPKSGEAHHQHRGAIEGLTKRLEVLEAQAGSSSASTMSRITDLEEKVRPLMTGTLQEDKVNELVVQQTGLAVKVSTMAVRVSTLAASMKMVRDNTKALEGTVQVWKDNQLQTNKDHNELERHTTGALKEFRSRIADLEDRLQALRLHALESRPGPAFEEKIDDLQRHMYDLIKMHFELTKTMFEDRLDKLSPEQQKLVDTVLP